MDSFNARKKLNNTIGLANGIAKYDISITDSLVRDFFRVAGTSGNDIEISLLSADVAKSMKYYSGEVKLKSDGENFVVSKGNIPVLATMMLPIDLFDNEAMVSSVALSAAPRFKKKVVARGVVVGDDAVFLNYIGGDNFIDALPDYHNGVENIRGHLKYRYVRRDSSYEEKVIIDKTTGKKMVYSSDGVITTPLNIGGSKSLEGAESPKKKIYS